MRARTWALVVLIAVLGSIVIGIVGNLPVIRDVTLRPKERVACQEDSACQNYIHEQIVQAIRGLQKGVVVGGGNNPSGQPPGQGNGPGPETPPNCTVEVHLPLGPELCLGIGARRR